jgi:hypothetical protein
VVIRIARWNLARQHAGRSAGRLWLVALSLAMAALGAGLRPAPAAAQASLSLAALSISLWPEFDRQGVLVILDGTLPPSTALPATVSLRMPAAAGQPNAAAYYGADGSLLAAAYTTAPAGNDIIITFSTESLQFRLEYYDPALTLPGAQRTYNFNWTSDYAVDVVGVRVQQPAGASALTIAPALTSTGAGEYGLDYYEGTLGALTPGQAVQVTVSYTKTGSALSADTLGIAPAAATAAPAPAAAGLGSTPLVLAIAGVAILAGAALGLMLWRSRQAAQAAHRRAPRRHRPAAQVRAQPRAVPRPAAPQPIRPSVAGEAAYCTQCGRRRQPDDKFCRQCGAPVTAERSTQH